VSRHSLEYFGAGGGGGGGFGGLGGGGFGGRDIRLVLLPHCEPLALLFVETELNDGGSFRGACVRRLHYAERYGARPHERDVPCPEFGWLGHARNIGTGLVESNQKPQPDAPHNPRATAGRGD
jgi:hypothetical protein